MSEQLALVRSEQWPIFQGESYEEHVSMWLEVDQSVQGHYWMLGAIAASLDKRYGEDIVGKFASDVRSSAKRIREYRQTYQTWQNGDRSPFLSFKHHTIAARSDESEQLLAIAESEELSTRELEQLVKTGEVPEKNVHFSSESAEWYTPPHIIEAVVEVLGTIDLDPCADDLLGIPAESYFTKEDDGLAREWLGRVFLNPPYGNVIDEWIYKLVAEHKRSNVVEAIALVPSRTDTVWFGRLRDYPRCFIRGRLKFSGHENTAPFPSAVFYLGPREGKARFVEVFGALGDVFERVKDA